MNVERMVDEFLERAEQDRQDGVARLLARHARRPRRRWRLLASWALLWFVVGALLGLVTSR